MKETALFLFSIPEVIVQIQDMSKETYKHQKETYKHQKVTRLYQKRTKKTYERDASPFYLAYLR